MILAGIVDQRLGRGEARLAVAQILVEEGEEIFLAPLRRGIAVPLKSPSDEPS